MPNPWIMKMEQFTGFSPDQRRRLEELSSERIETTPARHDILREGERVDECHLVVSGMAARYKILPDGSRQIFAFLVPGDLCDAEVFILERMDHSVAALSETRCAIIPAATMKELLREVSCLAEALWWGTMTDLAVLRERIVDHGRRDARERIAHLFYELLVRYRMVGGTEDESFPFPITQEELADATGLTPVHVNRTLQHLREDGLIELHGKVLKVLDPARLKTVAGFSADYLHLQRVEHGDASEEVAGRAGDLV
jgi:CRP-like cAMP-binding protein